MRPPGTTWTYKATAGDHDYAVYDEATGKDVALVRDFNEANARAIAAVPEMLAALEAVMREADFTADDGAADLGARLVEVERRARAALAKARGEEGGERA